MRSRSRGGIDDRFSLEIKKAARAMEDKTTKRPAVFIGSSAEKLAVAYAVQENLDHDAEVTVWTQGLFEPSRTAIETLEKQLPKFDFAIFVFTTDDLLWIRGETLSAVRDNVIFELGLATGILGRERSYILMPRTPTATRLPTDLVGITPLTYNPSRSDNNLLAALGPACNQLTRLIKTHGPLGRAERATAAAPTLSPKVESAAKSGGADSDGAAVAPSRKDDEVTRFMVAVVAKAESHLAPALRPHEHSRWAGVVGNARYYRMWYQSELWHRNQFRFQLWLESLPGRSRTLWVGFSLRQGWLEELGYPPTKWGELRQAMDAYAKQAGVSVLKDGEFVGINYEVPAPELSPPVIELAATRLFALINQLTPVIEKILPSTS